jgi:hypothetical protein
MGDAIKSLLSESIKVLEQGSFQEFCLSFLPIFDSKFVGLERHGGTANGRTRAGTPDLIKTNSDGSHICVQCSVDKDYWKKPEKLDEWKPIKDIIECVKKIDSITEIVLCASLEIPTNLPTVKSEIKNIAKIYTNALITTLSLSNFEETIRNNIYSFSELIKSFCPTVYEHLSAITRADIVEAKFDVYKKHSLSLDSIEAIFKNIYKDQIGKINKNQLTLEIEQIAKSRFQRTEFQKSNPITRASVKEFLSNNVILENAYLILGVPKIGKTSWVSDICFNAKKNGFEIIWFKTPYDQFELNAFTQDVKRIVIGNLAGFDISNQYADRKIGLDELTSHLLRAVPTNKYLLVIDDIQYLSDSILDYFKDIITVLKKSPIYKNIGIILISNKKVHPISGAVALPILCPPWNEIEIEQLLLLNKIKIQDEIKSYCKLMVSTCGGHPLVALAIAKKAPKIIDLLPLKPKSLPALYDEELTNEITRILFEDLLRDADHRDFVLRLSILIFRFDLDLADIVSTNIKPELRTPAKLMFENLKGTVIEGDDQLSYSVAFIFSKIAQTYLTEKQKQDIWDIVSNYLITPKDRIYNADKMIDAIYYSILAKKLEKVFYLTSFLIYMISQKPPTKEQIKYILDRLSIVEGLKFPDDNKLRLPYFMALFPIATQYTEIDELDKSNTILNKLVTYPLTNNDIPKQIEISADYLNTATRFFYFLNLLRTKNASSALKILNGSEVNYFIKIGLSPTRDISFLHVAIQQGELNDFPTDFIG